jgi:hypothetical protein
MGSRLRHEDPRCGREHFDLHAGMEWEWGIHPNEIRSVPDEPWGRFWQKENAPRILFSSGQWRVTSFGLELVSDFRERYERYEIPADQLLDMHGQVYRWPILVATEPWANLADFEVAFREAIKIFHRRRASAHVTMDSWINYRLSQQRPDNEILDRTFRRARGMVRRRATERRTDRNFPPRWPARSGVIQNRTLSKHQPLTRSASSSHIPASDHLVGA